MKIYILLMKISAFCHWPQEGKAKKWNKVISKIVAMCTLDNVSGEKGYQGNMERSLLQIIYQYGSIINEEIKENHKWFCFSYYDLIMHYIFDLCPFAVKKKKFA